MKLTKEEIRDIRAYDRNFDPAKIVSSIEARGEKINDVLIISLGRKEKHDSGYPFLQMIGRQYVQGIDPTVQYFDLGIHDHCICNIPVNVDSYGKNIFRFMPWGKESYWRAGSYLMPVASLEKKREWQVDSGFVPVSSIEIGCLFPEIQPANTIS